MLKRVSVLFLAALVFASATLSGCGFMQRFGEAFVEEAAKQAKGSPPPEGSPVQIAPATSGRIDAGIWNRNAYTNDYANLAYILPGAWSRESGEKMAEKNFGVSLSFNGTEYVDNLLESGPVYLVCAEDGKGASAYLMLRRLSAAEQMLSDTDFMRQAARDENAVSGVYAMENDGVLDMATLCGEKYYVLTTQVFSVENGQKTAHAWNATALRRLGDTLVKICAVGASREEAAARLEDFNGEKAPETPAKPVMLDAGRWTEDVYTNAYLGLTFTPLYGWKRSPDSTVTNFNKGKALPFNGTGDAEALLRENGGVAMFVVETKVRGSMGYIAVTRLSAKEKAMDRESFFEMVMESFNNEETDVWYTPGANTTVTLDGRKYDVAESIMYEKKNNNKQWGAKWKWNIIAVTRTDEFLVLLQCLSDKRECVHAFLDSFSTTSMPGVKA